MKFTTIALLFLAFVVATIQAVMAETNAERLARGLPPRAPRKLYRDIPTRSDTADRHKPSGKPSLCSTGPVECCEEVTKASSKEAKVILELLGLFLPPETVVGLTCSSLLFGNSCFGSQAVCCDKSELGGIIAIGCAPVKL
ncbi:fungal hydrophobin [Trametes elegans]|nr:fungal hydrophobin [Trametes elegans]